MDKITGQLRFGVLFSAIGQYGTTIMTLIVTSVLSRLLSPDQYGIVAIVLVFLSFFQIFAELGAGPAIIQNKDMTDKDNSDVFWVLLMMGIVLGGVFAFSGHLVAFLYKQKELVNVFLAMSPLLVVSVLTIVPNAILLKQKRFRAVNFITLIGAFLGAIVGILSALIGLGIYSLVLSNLIPAIMKLILMFKESNLKLKKIGYHGYTKISSFSRYQFGFTLINFFSRNLDNLLVGKYFGAVALANYNKSYQLIMYPNTIFTNVITPVLQPIFSSDNVKLDVLKEAYERVLFILSLIGVPLSLYMAMMSKQIIVFLYGNQWMAAVTPFMILSVTVWIQMLISTTGSVFQSVNKVGFLMFGGIISALILVTSILIGLLVGDINGLALSLTVGFFVNFVFSFSLLYTVVFKSTIIDVIRLILKPILISLVPGLMLQLVLNLHVVDKFNVFLSLASTGLGYFAIVLFLYWKVLKVNLFVVFRR